MDSYTDIELIKKVIDKDDFAFEALVKRYEKLVYSVSYRMMNNKEDAEDITQIVFIKVYKKIESFKENQSFKAWICTIASNACIDEIRSRKNKQTYSLDKNLEGDDGEFKADIPSSEETPEEVIINKEKRQVILDSINELKEESRQLIILRDVQGLSYDEIAEQLDLKLGTVKSKIARSRTKLQKIIESKMELLNK